MGLPLRAALAAMMLWASVAPAQPPGPRRLELAAKASFKHRYSKVQLPPVLAGLPRSGAVEYEADQLDTMSEYARPDLSEVYTVFIFRNVAGGIPVWFDRASWMLEHRSALGTPVLRRAAGFIPPGRANASGLLATYALTGKAYRSTGVALLPVGEWMVKMRASSQTLSPEELEARMKAALAEIVWQRKMAPAPVAVPIASCETPLALSGNAKPAEKDDSSGAAMLVGALIGQMGAVREAPKGAVPPVTRWCRDSIEVAEGAVYRADEQKDGYLIALADSGRAIGAGRNAAMDILEDPEERKIGGVRYEVQMIFLARTTTSALFDRLPPPAQALAIARNGPFATSFGTWGKGKGTLTVGDEMLK